LNPNVVESLIVFIFFVNFMLFFSVVFFVVDRAWPKLKSWVVLSVSGLATFFFFLAAAAVANVIRILP
jgi:uncharacterized membrane protein YagU involved in acid resistance